MRRAGGWNRWIVAGVVALVAAVLPLGAAEAAETKTWNGPDLGSWSVGSHWLPVGAPQEGDAIVLPAGTRTVYDLAGVEVGSISTLPGSAETSVGGSAPIPLAGNVTVQGGDLWFGRGLLLGAGQHEIATSGGAVYVNQIQGDGDVRTTGSGLVEFWSTVGYNGAIEVRGANFYTMGLGSAERGLTLAAGTHTIVSDDNSGSPFSDAITVLDGPVPALLEGIFSQLNGPVELRGDLQLLHGYSMGGTISGPGGLEIVRAWGMLRIDGANTYTGGTVVSQDLMVSGESPLGTGSVDVRPGSALELGDGTILDNDVAFESTDAGQTEFLRVLGAATINGPLTISGTQTAGIDFAGNGALEFNGGVQSTAPLDLRNTLEPDGAPSMLIAGASSIPSLSTNSVDVALATGPTGDVGNLAVGGDQVRGTNLTFLGDHQHDPATPISVGSGILDLWGSDQGASQVIVTFGSQLYLGVVIDGVADTSRLGTSTFQLNTAQSGVEFVISETSNDRIVASSVALAGEFRFYYQGLTPVGFGHVLIENTGNQPVQGTFDNAPEGSVWFGGQQMYVLSYVGGNGNDVTLTRVGGLQSTWSYDELVDHGGRMLGAPALSSWGHGRLDAWAVGLDRQLWHRWSQGGGAAWEPLGGTLLSTPAAVSQRPGEADVFARGADNALWMRSYRSGWGPWVRLGGILSEAPSVTSWAPGRIDIAARGADGAVWHGSIVNDVFQRWTPLGGFTPSAPSITDWGAGHLDVFARGGDGALWQKTFANGSWGPSVSHGGILTDGPATASSTFGELAVYARGADGLLWHRSLEFFGWSEWTNLELPIHERPAVVGTDPGHMQLAVRSPASSLWSWHVFQPWTVGAADASAADTADADGSDRNNGGAMGVRLVGPLPPAG